MKAEGLWANVSLYPHQEDAVKRMKNGCILCGGVGSGKSRTALAYYVQKVCRIDRKPDIYIITTAAKRDSGEWESECLPFLLFPRREDSIFEIQVVIDSWNNIGKYVGIEHAFFIFDEQRVVGKGAWVKSFLKIVRNGNQWILLSATPGDTWSDYIPVFIANGFYKNRSEFVRNHVVYSQYCKFPKIQRYLGCKILAEHRQQITVDMECQKPAEQHHTTIFCDYNKADYDWAMRERWNPFENDACQAAGELCGVLRRICNTDVSRQNEVLALMMIHCKAIIFYNFDYELEILRELFKDSEYVVREWNGHKHEHLPKEEEKWVYLVQYMAGCEGWNCTETDTMIFFSQNYSYRITVQAAGRIDRITTPFKDLYYYHLRSRSPIDRAIARALGNKKDFNERRFLG